MLTFSKCKSIFLWTLCLFSIVFNSIKQIQGEMISKHLHPGESHTGILYNSQMILINYCVRNNTTFSSNCELSPIVYKSHLNLQSKSKEEIQREILKNIRITTTNLYSASLVRIYYTSAIFIFGESCVY